MGNIGGSTDAIAHGSTQGDPAALRGRQDDEKDFGQISIRINGGRVGLLERKRYRRTAQEVLGVV